MSDDDLLRRINHHTPDEDGTARILLMRGHALHWALAIKASVPDGREQSLALTKLEEALMWANAGIARDPDHWATSK